MATRTIANGGGNFNATGTWVEGVVPVAGDNVVATATSGQLTVNVASGGVGLGSFIMTGYTGIITMTNTLTIAGTMTLVSGMGTIAGTGAIILTTTATITSGGKVIPALTLGGTSQTYTLGDNFQVGIFSNASATTLSTLNGNTLSCSSNVTISKALAGTTNIVYNTSTSQTITCSLACSLPTQTFNASGTITISSYTCGGGTLTYTAGAMSLGTSTLTVNATSTINTSGMTWYTVTFNATSTITLTSNLNCTLFTNAGTTPTITVNGNNIYCTGLTSSANASILTGTTNVILDGTGNLGGTATNNGSINLSVEINTAGTVTVLAYIKMGTGGTLTYTAGTVDLTSNATTLQINGNPTLNTAGMVFPSVTMYAISSPSLTSLLTCSGTITNINFATSWLGTYGFTCANHTTTVAGTTLTTTFKDGNTYTITTSLNMGGTLAIHSIFASSHATNVAYIVLQQGASQDNSFLDGTRIDSSGGKTICTYKGTLTTTTNWRLLPTDLQSRGSIW